MRILFFYHLQNARDSLRANKLRSFLTMVGIAIGVASVTAILSLGDGASRLVASQVEDAGSSIVVVRPGPTPTSALDGSLSFQPNQFAASSLTMADVVSLQKIEGVTAVAPIMIVTGSVVGSNPAPAGTTIVATSPDFIETVAVETRLGEFLPQLSRPSVVIGAQLAIDLFGTQEILGKTVTIKGQSHVVTGVLTRLDQPINYTGVDLDNAAIISLEAGQLLAQSSLQLQQINVATDSVENLDTVTVAANKALLRNHFGQDDFHVLSGAAISQPTSDAFLAIAGVTTAIAAISLLVGGIGVMNIMLVGVAERTREIGIRKALGASNGDIIGQFLMEALLLSIGGGIVGLILGYAVAVVVSLSLPFSPTIGLETIGIAAIVSLGVGIIFGLYPAIKAAGKDPIAALRYHD